jgi:hypothetical protein
MSFNYLGFVVMPLLALFFYRVLVPPPEDSDQFDRDPTAANEVPGDGPAPAEYRQPTAGLTRAAGAAPISLAPLLLLGIVGYILFLLIRGIRLPHRS